MTRTVRRTAEKARPRSAAKTGPGSTSKAGPRSKSKARPRETGAELRRRALKILKALKREYPTAHCELDYRTPYELLVATILSAQCTDARVNLVTPRFFARFPTPASLAGADRSEVEELIRSTGFFRNKAKSLVGMAEALVGQHQGAVPREMEALRALPGVGRKTANVILGNAYGINEGITVDTHVTRLAGLLRLSREKTPERIEQDLMELIPREDWTLVSHLLIWHGRRVCIAQRPRCEACVVRKLCPSTRVP